MGLFRNPPMAFQRFLPFGLILAAPLLAACNQTAAAPESAPMASGISGSATGVPSPTPGLPGSSAIAAIMDAHQTRAQHSLTATMANHAASLDRTGTSAYANKAMYEGEQRRAAPQDHALRGFPARGGQAPPFREVSENNHML